MAVAVVAAAVALGFAACWLFVARPIRQRADAADHRASQAERSRAEAALRSTDRGIGEPARADDITVSRLRFYYLAKSPPPGARATPDTTPAGERIRLVIERMTITMRQRDEAGGLGKVDDLSERVREDAGLRQRFVDAASEYAAGRIGSGLFEVTQRWETRDVAGFDAVAQALRGSDEWLHDLVGRPLAGAASGLGLPQPGAAVFGGIGSTLVLEPLDREIGDAVRFCEIVGIVVGLATGVHPLAISCTKSLARDVLDERLGAAIKGVFRDNAIAVDRDPPQASATRHTPSVRETLTPEERDRRARWDPAARDEWRDRTEPDIASGPIDERGTGRG
jgi:hypothetical protein